MKECIRIGVAGSGFIARNLVDLLTMTERYDVSCVLTHSDISQRNDFPFQQIMTNSIDELIEKSDIVVECTGEVTRAGRLIEKVLAHGLKVVTMNTEFHITLGSHFVEKGFITEAEGDQPGSIAALYEEAVTMGFEPMVLGNIKGFMNLDPSKEDMQYWSKKSRLSLEMVTSFTDGTKVQMEQCFVANGLGAGIARQGLMAPTNTNIPEGGAELAAIADKLGHPISDFLISSSGPAGVFVTARHMESQKQSLEYYKLGKGPYYTLIRDFHLPHMELLKTLDRVVRGGGILLDNSAAPTISVAAVAKHDLAAGLAIPKGIGSFDMRGEAIVIEGNREHVPIGLLENAVLKKELKQGDVITYDDVEFTEDYALNIWKSILNKEG